MNNLVANTINKISKISVTKQDLFQKCKDFFLTISFNGKVIFKKSATTIQNCFGEYSEFIWKINSSF